MVEEGGNFSSRFSKNWERGILLPVVPCAQRAQPSTLTLGARMPCGARRVPEQGSIEPVSVELWRRYQRRRCCSSSMEVRILQADPSSMAWSRALRAADSASRISPLSLTDKCGRMRQFYEAVAFDQKFLWSGASLRLLADPHAIPYPSSNLPVGATTSSAYPVVADHKSMPRKAVF